MSLVVSRRAVGVGVTWLDLAKTVAAEHERFGITDEEADFVLWEFTCFPFGTVLQVAEQLDAVFDTVPPSGETAE